MKKECFVIKLFLLITMILCLTFEFSLGLGRELGRPLGRELGKPVEVEEGSAVSEEATLEEVSVARRAIDELRDFYPLSSEEREELETLKKEIGMRGSSKKEILEKAGHIVSGVEVRKYSSKLVVNIKRKRAMRKIMIMPIDRGVGVKVEVVGNEVFLYKEKLREDGVIEIEGFGEYGLLPELGGNEKTVAKLFDRKLQGKEEGQVTSVTMMAAIGIGNELDRDKKVKSLFKEIGQRSIEEAYMLIRKEGTSLRFIPNVVKSVGSEEERKYVYKNIGEKEKEEKNKVWIEGINEIKNYREDEDSIGKYSDSKVGAIVGYGRVIGERAYIGIYMKTEKDEIKQGGGNSGEVVNVGVGVCGGYERKIDIKWLGYIGMNKYKTERESIGGKGKAEFSGREIGLDVEIGLKIGSKVVRIIRPYIGIGARKSSYENIEEKWTLIDVMIKEGSYKRCVGRIGVEGNKEISKKVEIVGRMEYERVIKGERGEVKIEGGRRDRRER
jgi:hypothetical protein